MHNLGNFDGVFIYKAISNRYKPTDVKTLIDHDNKFITISLKLNSDLNITWLDSYRIFPVSLNDLCGTFNVKGKVQKYDPLFNNLKLFKDKLLIRQFKKYALQDAYSLYLALHKAQEIYLEQYAVDVCSIFSTSFLSFKIFRLNSQEEDIPIIKGNIDVFIRKSYFGGHTDYFKGHLKRGYHYDINSLFPFAMLKDMTLK